jgi:4'-phosphopantetheinyl transferase
MNGAPPLNPGDIHVWIVDLSLDEERISSLFTQLSSDEQDRAARLLLPKGRQQFIAARGQLRQILASYLSTPPRELLFTYGAHGKPSLQPPHDTPVQFNLSHSGNLALLAVNLDRPIGVDIELAKPGRPFLKLSERFFSLIERNAIRRLDPDQIQDGFYACWTRKEAYLKAIGTGLATPLNAFDVTLAPGDPPALTGQRIDPKEPSRWHLFEVPVPPGYRAAVATGWETPSLSIYN